MASPKRKDPNEPKRLASGKYDKTDVRYYKWIGRKGGNNTKKAHPSHYSDMAKLRHGTLTPGVPAPAKAPSRPTKRARKQA